MDNYDIALKAEAKKVIRCFQKFSSEERANHAASHRLGYRQRARVGEYFYIHPDIPEICFDKRFDAAREGLRRQS